MQKKKLSNFVTKIGTNTLIILCNQIKCIKVVQRDQIINAWKTNSRNKFQNYEFEIS